MKNQRKSKEKSRENKGNQREIKGSQGEGEAGSQGKEEKEEKLLWKEEKVLEQPPCAATGRHRRRRDVTPSVSHRSPFFVKISFWTLKTVFKTVFKLYYGFVFEV